MSQSYNFVSSLQNYLQESPNTACAALKLRFPSPTPERTLTFIKQKKEKVKPLATRTDL